MTETWAGLLSDAASRIEGEDHAQAPLAGKLTRLASLLEQITPEMVEKLRAEATYQLSSDEGADTDVGEMLRSLADLLRALSTAPTEETEDR